MTDEQTYTIEIYHRNKPEPSVSGTYSSLEEAKKVASDFLNASVREVRVLDHEGNVLDTFKKEAR